MPCATVTVTAPSVESATISGMSVSGGVNTATLDFTVNNPNSVPVNVDVGYTVDGSSEGTETISVSANGSQSVSRTFEYNLGQGDNDLTSDICADVQNTVTQ